MVLNQDRAWIPTCSKSLPFHGHIYICLMCYIENISLSSFPTLKATWPVCAGLWTLPDPTDPSDAFGRLFSRSLPISDADHGMHHVTCLLYFIVLWFLNLCICCCVDHCWCHLIISWVELSTATPGNVGNSSRLRGRVARLQGNLDCAFSRFWEFCAAWQISWQVHHAESQCGRGLLGCLPLKYWHCIYICSCLGVLQRTFFPFMSYICPRYQLRTRARTSCMRLRQCWTQF